MVVAFFFSLKGPEKIKDIAEWSRAARQTTGQGHWTDVTPVFVHFQGTEFSME